MKHVIICIAATISLLFGACTTSRKAAPVIEQSTQERDSVRVEYRERVVFVPDTLYVEIPSQTAERETTDSVSVLENDFAKSLARITPDGLLFHNLETKPQNIAAPYERPVVEKETKESHVADKEEAKTKTKTIIVPRDYTWWDYTRFYGLYAAIIFLIITYRRNILNAVQRVFRKK